MGLTAKFNKRISSLNSGGSSSKESWGMGFFLVFFPEEHHHHRHHKQEFNSPIPSSSSSLPFNSLLKRTNSYQNIFTRAQSTISICALLIFLTLLLFTLSTFEPNNNLNHHLPLRRRLSQKTPNFYTKPISNSPALQGLGTLHTRGTGAMNELVLCHVTEHVSPEELKSFLWLFHRSGLASKSDLLFIFPSVSTPESFDNIIQEENVRFLKLLRNDREGEVMDSPASSEVTQLVKSRKDSAVKGEPIWGRKTKSNSSGTESTRTSYGSVVGFGVGELDPENTLSGFIDHIPMNLRRWACYPMILGRVRRSFKHVMLVDLKEVLPLGLQLGRISNRSPESVYLLSTSPAPTKHGRESSDKTHQGTVNPAIIIGGARGIRRLSAAMLTEIVRATMRQQHSKKKNKNSVTESALLSQLAGNEFLQKSIRFGYVGRVKVAGH